MAEQPFILIVDDEPDFREIFGAKLTAMGCRVETAENGAAALEKLASMTPDLVLMDVKMPVMDGATAVLKMKADPRLKDLRVAFLTSLGDPRFEMQEINRKFAAEVGAHYLQKTEDLDILGEQIKRILSS